VTADAAISSEYWNLNTLQQSNIGFIEAQDEFLRLMNESMKLHLRSDVPLGIFLSGGIDSSIITVLASKLTSKPLNTFTIGYNKEGSFYDEREYAKIVARLFNTNHQEFLVNPDIEEAIFKLIGYFDEPFANSSAIPNYYISKAMREKVKVALSGLGGDEIAGGYERYAGMKLLSNFNKLPSFLKNIGTHSLKLLPDSKKGNYFADRCKRFVQASNLSPRETYYSLIASSNDKRKKLILSNSSTYQNSYDLFLNIINNAKQSDILREMMYFDIVSYMTNDLLVLTDRTSMANSLEVRVPFLDHKLVEFMFQLPFEYKIKGMQKKYILKKIFRNVLPDRILFRKKRGFSTPLSVWLRNDLQSFAQNIFIKERIESTGVLNYKGIQLLLSEHLTRKANHQGILFALMTFIIWHEMYLQEKGNNFIERGYSCSKC
jgi:asparagine synthase (glutamine-hydrolysing)